MASAGNVLVGSSPLPPSQEHSHLARARSFRLRPSDGVRSSYAFDVAIRAEDCCFSFLGKGILCVTIVNFSKLFEPILEPLKPLKTGARLNRPPEAPWPHVTALTKRRPADYSFPDGADMPEVRPPVA